MSVEKEWTADLIRHIRTVHFALLFLACGLISVGAGYGKAAQEALPVAEQISKFCSDWPVDWLERSRPFEVTAPRDVSLYFYIPPETGSDYDKKYEGPNILCCEGGLKARYPSGTLITKGLKGVKVTLKKPRHAWRAYRRVETPSFGGDVPAGPAELFVDRPPATLAEFRDWWDTTRALEVDYFSFHLHYGDDTFKAEQLREGNWSPDEVYVQTSPLAIPAEDVEVVPDVDLSSAPLVLALTDTSLITPPIQVADYSFWRLHVPLQQYVPDVKVDAAKLNPLWARRSGTFLQAFPELKGIEVGLYERRFDSLVTKLEEQAAEPQTFELGLLKFQVARWGILLVLIAQAYLWLLVRELGGKTSGTGLENLDVAWVGFFTGKKAQLAFLSSLLVPAVAVFVLAHQMVPSMHWLLSWGYQAGVTAVSVWLAVATFRRSAEDRTVV